MKLLIDTKPKQKTVFVTFILVFAHCAHIFELSVNQISRNFKFASKYQKQMSKSNAKVK